MDEKIVLKICGSEWDNASRDKRELTLYRELGCETVVLAKGQADDKGRVDNVSGFKVFRYTTRPLGKRIPVPVNRVFSLFDWAKFVRQIDPDVISGHDLPGLTIAWIYKVLFAKKQDLKLIYDSHEFELGRNMARSKLQTSGVALLEKFLMKRCAFSIMVNDTIADEVQRIHGLKERPVVIRSTPNNWEIEPSACESKRAELMAKFPGKVNFLMMFHGNLGRGNGIELLLKAVESNEDIGLVLMGEQTDKQLISELKEMSSAYGIGDRVLYIPPVKVEDIWKYSGACDLEMMVIEPIVKSYYYVLPNKFFESVQSLVPIISSDLPEMKKLIDKYEIGLYCKPNDIDGLNACIEKMRRDKEFYARCRENLKTAKEELCWENEKQVLKEAFSTYIKP